METLLQENQYESDVLDESDTMLLASLVQHIVTTGTNSVTFEGPPTYIYPDPNYPTQHYDHAVYQHGWTIAHQLTNLLARWGINHEHYFLLDDYNGLAPQQRQTAVSDFMRMVIPTLPVLGISHHRYETEFAEIPEGDSCERMDARFQLYKIRTSIQPFFEQLIDPRIPLQTIPLPQHIIVHPITFWDQQRGMLRTLRRLLGKDDILSQIPSENGRRAQLLLNFRHIWLDPTQVVIESITKIKTRKKRYTFEPI